MQDSISNHSDKPALAAVNRATTSDVLRDQLDAGERASPQLVTLGIGINDIGHGLSLEQFSKNYEEILRRLANIPDISRSSAWRLNPPDAALILRSYSSETSCDARPSFLLFRHQLGQSDIELYIRW